MKLTTSLVFAAIAAASACAVRPSQIQENSTEGSATSYCPNISCPDEYDPVTDENGVTYPNKCTMEDAKCKGPREDVDDEYKRLYGKESGAPRDENKGRLSSDSDKCDVVCTEVSLSPICGSDGVGYSSLCELEVAACKNPAANIVEEACFTTDV